MLLDAAALQKSAEMHPEVREFLTSNPVPKLDWENAENIASVMDALSKASAEFLGTAEPAILEEYREIPMRDGTHSKMKIHRPTSPPANVSPLIVFFFGGGWVGGDPDAGTATARAYVRLFDATVVNVSYRLAPQHKFPVGQFDCWDTVKWLDGHANEIGADPGQGFVVSGLSAGASNAICVTAHSLEGDDVLIHPITGQHLCAASLMDKEHVPDKYRSYFVAQDQNKDEPVLPTSALAAMKRHTGWDSESPWRFVVNSKAPLSKFPPTYFQISGMDILRDDSLIYDEMLQEAGVKTKVDLYPGCPHTHFAFFQGIGPSIQAIGDMVVGIGWLLGKDITREVGLGALMKPPVAS